MVAGESRPSTAVDKIDVLRKKKKVPSVRARYFQSIRVDITFECIYCHDEKKKTTICIQSLAEASAGEFSGLSTRLVFTPKQRTNR